MSQTSFFQDVAIYVGRVKEFKPIDYIVYVLWIGKIFGLFAATFGFIYLGYANGVTWPSYVWNIPIGALIFTGAIALDTIGHRTIYKEELEKGEALVHHITIFFGITSILALCLAYENPSLMYHPALVLIALSIFYSAVDEAMHWRRYLTKHSDRVEMWSHVFILTGHMIMVLTWWHWYTDGYPGVSETLRFLNQ